MRKKNIYITAIVGLCEETVAIICGFILPRMILTYFGSAYNGIVAAVTQFIGCIALLKSGIGMATKAALYEPLVSHNQDKINGIMAATMKFLRKVACIFIVGIVAFAIIYPAFINKEFSWLFTFSLVLIISLGTFFQYYFGLANQLLLEADQKYYIVSSIAIINTAFNTIISVICMKAGMSIHEVKLCSATVYCITPILLHLYVNKKYSINRRTKPDNDSISQRWNAFGMQIANFVNNNTDIIVASIFLNLKEVSVYTIYYLAINGVKKAINRITTGVESALGCIAVSEDKQQLTKKFLVFEYILNVMSIIAFSILISIIVPFVKVYTRGVTDVQYDRYIFAVVACTSELFFCLRIAYTQIIQAKGAFKETKHYYYIEAIINIILSVILVNLIGLVGIVIGTLVAMVYRTITSAVYTYKEILSVDIKSFYFRIAFTVINIMINIIVISFALQQLCCKNYITLVMFAVISFIISVILTLLLNFLAFRHTSKEVLKRLLGTIRKQK